MMPKSGNRFPAFAKPASAGEGRSDKFMRNKFVEYCICHWTHANV